MFRKVHYRLTLLSAGITTFILIIMSLFYLYVSESGLEKSQFLSFQRDMSTLIANFEQQTVITYEWLSKIENNNSYFIHVADNGVPFLFNNRNRDDKRRLVQEEALQYYASHFMIESIDSELDAYHFEFKFTASDGTDYYSCLAVIPSDRGEVQVLILSPLDRLYTQIKEQRIRFLAINVAAIVLLSLFSYFFTKKLLLPIEKNRQEQIQFVAAASHELRTPLAVILSCTSACKKASPEEEEGFLATILSEGQRMSGLIDDMLFLSKADRHSFDIHMEKIEPDTLLLNSYEAFEPMAREKNITLQIALPDGAVPACLGDSSRISQVIAILLHNAVSYTPAGGNVRLSLTLGSEGINLKNTDHRKPAQSFTITVSDNGIGIPDTEKEYIFRRFYRAETSHSTKDHFGLGLCIASEIITALNGTIHVSDTPGGGSTFIVAIPMLHPASS